MTLTILKTESFLPLGPAIKKPVAEKPFVPEQVRPGVFKGADGKLYTNFKEHETPAVFHPPKQQVPSALAEQAAFETWLASECPSGDVESVQYQWVTSSDYADLFDSLAEAPLPTLPVVPNALGDGWIAWGGGMCPIARRTKVEIHFREESRVRPDINNPTDRPEDLRWSHNSILAAWDIVAYRLIP
jgi:hypothetical protein